MSFLEAGACLPRRRCEPRDTTALDELWDLLDKTALPDDLHSIDDAVFSTEEEELKFWATLDAESADSGECRSP